MSDFFKDGIVLISNDHAGYRLKKLLMEERSKLRWRNLGAESEDRVDYPKYADVVASRIASDPTLMGVLICGSGQGMAMRANRYPKVRAAVCYDVKSTEYARAHNDANILCLGSRLIHHDMALKLLDVFLDTPFEGGRHGDRVKMLDRSVKGPTHDAGKS